MPHADRKEHQRKFRFDRAVADQTTEFNQQHDYLGELALLKQWCVWMRKVSDGRIKKVPLNPTTGTPASVNDPDTWGGYEDAAAARHNGDGIGFLFTEDDPYCGIDLDGAIDTDTGELAEWALDIVKRIASYTEISPSGTGLHIILRGKLPPDARHKAAIGEGSIEMYDAQRYFTITRAGSFGYSIRNAQSVLDALYNDVFEPQAPDEATTATPPAHAPRLVGADDAFILAKARRAKNGEKFVSLYDRGEVRFTNPQTGGPDRSRAHLALVSMLAFWTQDEEQIERLFSASAFGESDKWQRPDYRAKTIARALRALPPRTPQSTTTPEVQAQLRALEAEAVAQPWTGRRAAKNYHLLLALIHSGLERGRPHPDGVAVAPSLRYLALTAGIAKEGTVLDGLSDLEEAGWFYVARRGSRDQMTPNLYILREATHLGSGDKQLCTTPPQTRRLLMQVRDNGRSAPGGERKIRYRDPTSGRIVTESREVAPSIPRVQGSIGKVGAVNLEKLILAGEPLTQRDWAHRIGCRPYDFQRRYLPVLLGAGLAVETQEDVYDVAPDLDDRLLDHLCATGAIAVYEGQRVELFELGSDAGEDALLGPERTTQIVQERAEEAREDAQVGNAARLFVLKALDDAPGGPRRDALKAQWKARGGKLRHLNDALYRMKFAGEIEFQIDLLGDWRIVRTREAH